MLDSKLGTILKNKGGLVHSVEPEATVMEAVQLMNQNKIGALLVHRGKRLLGIFTERDVLVRVVDAGLDPNTTLIQQVMTTNLHTENSSITVSEAMKIMTTERFRHLPIVDGERLMGVVSIGDLMIRTLQENKSYSHNLLAYIHGQHVS